MAVNNDECVADTLETDGADTETAEQHQGLTETDTEPVQDISKPGWWAKNRIALYPARRLLLLPAICLG